MRVHVDKRCVVKLLLYCVENFVGSLDRVGAHSVAGIFPQKMVSMIRETQSSHFQKVQ